MYLGSGHWKKGSHWPTKEAQAMSLESWARGEAGQWTIEEPVLGSRQMKQDKKSLLASTCLETPEQSICDSLVYKRN